MIVPTMDDMRSIVGQVVKQLHADVKEQKTNKQPVQRAKKSSHNSQEKTQHFLSGWVKSLGNPEGQWNKVCEMDILVVVSDWFAVIFFVEEEGEEGACLHLF